jgi:CubicO group peptidase (beta-lactamase class C family)
MRDLVLRPAGMTHSTYEQPLPESRAGEAAHAHDARGREIAGRWHTYPEMAAAGLWTTPSDLLRWATTIADARAGKSAVLLSRETATQMLTEQKAGFGLGPQLWGSGRALRFGHGGSNAGYRCLVVYFPETGQGAAVMTNGDGGGELTEEIVRTIAAEYRWPAMAPERIVAASLDSATLDAVVGEYDVVFPSFGKAKARITRQSSGRLRFAAPPVFDGEELVPVSATELVLATSGFRVVTERDASSARVTGFTISRENQKAHATRAR